MALSMMDKAAARSDKSAWPAEIAAEFERESRNPNPCVGNQLVSESDRVRVWMIEKGDTGRHAVFTQNLLAVSRKPRGGP